MSFSFAEAPAAFRHYETEKPFALFRLGLGVSLAVGLAVMLLFALVGFVLLSAARPGWAAALRRRGSLRDAFLRAIARLSKERLRDGAYDWGVFEDTADPDRFVETFRVDSWLEHLRQHERVTNADRVLQETVRRFHSGDAPKVTHLIGIRGEET